ncbi:2898_t:CDS:2 [Paraglomus brasilianum]|uniref:2898_t:CDS:1 n=1 Tax=Paraglomus brasilianum TaxID=144538 RepID=A0A9N8VTN9_9GLOM|nr:2898_t:CDS:2 [Paraglomus brasilianum]
MVQGLNLQPIRYAINVLRNPKLLVPTIVTRDIRFIPFSRLKQFGIKVLVCDKDNTLTLPYDTHLHKPFEDAWKQALDEFGRDNVVIISNSAGTPDDPGSSKAREIEQSIGKSQQSLSNLPISAFIIYRASLSHCRRKPGIPFSAVRSHFQHHTSLRPHEAVVIGDRLLTDVLFGNVNGMPSILVTDVPSELGDNPSAVKIRRAEHRLVQWMVKKGIEPLGSKEQEELRKVMSERE